MKKSIIAVIVILIIIIMIGFLTIGLLIYNGAQSHVSSSRSSFGTLYEMTNSGYVGLSTGGAKNVENFRENIKNTIEWCESNGIKCLFLIAQNKHSVYPENYLSIRPEGICRVDQLISIMDELNAEYIYPKDLFIEKKKQTDIPLYYETDTHWNPLGAYYAFKEIQGKLNKLFPDVSFPEIEYDTKVEYSYDKGDIIPMLGIDNAICTRPELNPKDASFEEYYEYLEIRIEGKDRFKYAKNKEHSELPKAIVFSNLFCNTDILTSLPR